MLAIRTLPILLAATVAVSACWRRGGNEQGPLYSGPVKVVVDNKHWQDVTVYVVHDGERSRVGVATATTIATFTLAPHQLGQTGLIRLIADPIGSRTMLSTENIVVKPGQEVQWTLESQLQRSVIAVY